MDAWQETMRHPLWDVLEYGDVVYHNEEHALLVTYNGSHTFNVWVESAPGFFRNTECFGSSEILDSRDARAFAKGALDAMAQ